MNCHRPAAPTLDQAVGSKEDSTCGSAASSGGRPRFAKVCAICASHWPERSRPSRKRSAWPSWNRTLCAASAKREAVAPGPNNSATLRSSSERSVAPCASRPSMTSIFPRSASTASRRTLDDTSRSNFILRYTSDRSRSSCRKPSLVEISVYTRIQKSTAGCSSGGKGMRSSAARALPAPSGLAAASTAIRTPASIRRSPGKPVPARRFTPSGPLVDVVVGRLYTRVAYVNCRLLHENTDLPATRSRCRTRGSGSAEHAWHHELPGEMRPRLERGDDDPGRCLLREWQLDGEASTAPEIDQGGCVVGKAARLAGDFRRDFRCALQIRD